MRVRSALPAAGPVLLAAAALGTAAAPAAAPRPEPRLRAASVVTPATVAGAGTRLRVRGVLVNSGGRSSAASLTLRLRSEGRPHVTVPLGRRTTALVAAGGRRAFSTVVTVRAAALPARVSSRYRLVVCVRRTPADRVSRCRAARTTLRLRPRPAGPVPVTTTTTTTTSTTPATTTTTPAGTTTTTTTTTTTSPGPVTPADTTAPATTDDVPATYQGAPIAVTLTAADEAGGSGVAATYYTVGTSPAEPTTASPVYSAAARPTLSAGQVIRYRSADVAGNLEATRTSRVALVDTAAPSTTDDVTSTPSSALLTATLTPSDTGGSGVQRTYYTVGSNPPVPTTASSVYDPADRPRLAGGERIRYFSVDFAGNAEAPRLSAAAVVDTSAFTPGARSAGDTLFPDIGSGGYDAQRYDLDLDYTIASKLIAGTATVTVKATQNLSRLTFDFAPWLRVSAVTVDGAPAAFRQGPATPATAGGSDYDYDLDVTPPAPGVVNGDTVDVAVTYAGVTQPVIDPDGAQDGWIPSPTYGAIAVSEPIGAMGWFPGNNVPFDKATFRISMSVPEIAPPRWVAVGTGVLQSETVAGGRRTYVWDDPDPTAPYLASVAIAKFDLATGTSTQPPPATNPVTVPFYTAVDSSFAAPAKLLQLADLNRTPAILDYYAEYFGKPYPFNAMGGVNPRQSVGYSLETQGKPTYAVSSSAGSTGAGIDTVAHENGHMYFGDDVTLTQWKDIWLNEGMTEFSAWLWSANRNAGLPLALRFQSAYDNPTPDFWRIPPAAPPTAADIFDDNAMYVRGAATMTAIHEILGDASFRVLMHRWLTEGGRGGGNATTEQFVALVKAHDPLHAARWDAFFEQWLYTSYPGVGPLEGRPDITPSTF